MGSLQGAGQHPQAWSYIFRSGGKFFDPRGFQLADVKHSREEGRFYWVGKSESGRVLTTRFTRRGRRIRVIGSAEWRKFRRLYDETTKPE